MSKNCFSAVGVSSSPREPTRTQGHPSSVSSFPKMKDKDVKGRRTRQAEFQARFRRAFARSLAVRSRVLGRRLTREEWKALSAAVKKQIRQETTPVARRLNRVIDRVVELEKPVQRDVGPEIRDVYDRISLLRRQLLLAMEEATQLSETCPHAAKKANVTLIEPVRYIANLPGFGCIDATMPPRKHVLCCSRCLQRREDALFEWSGQLLPHTLPELTGDRWLKRQLEGLNPLAFQPIWTAVLDIRYER